MRRSKSPIRLSAPHVEHETMKLPRSSTLPCPATGSPWDPVRPALPAGGVDRVLAVNKARLPSLRDPLGDAHVPGAAEASPGCQNSARLPNGSVLCRRADAGGSTGGPPRPADG